MRFGNCSTSIVDIVCIYKVVQVFFPYFALKRFEAGILSDLSGQRAFRNEAGKQHLYRAADSRSNRVHGRLHAFLHSPKQYRVGCNQDADPQFSNDYGI